MDASDTENSPPPIKGTDTGSWELVSNTQGTSTPVSVKAALCQKILNKQAVHKNKHVPDQSHGKWPNGHTGVPPTAPQEAKGTMGAAQ